MVFFAETVAWIVLDLLRSRAAGVAQTAVRGAHPLHNRVLPRNGVGQHAVAVALSLGHALILDIIAAHAVVALATRCRGTFPARCVDSSVGCRGATALNGCVHVVVGYVKKIVILLGHFL